MFGSKYDLTKAQQNFFDEFQRQYGKKIEKVEFAQLNASKSAFSELNIIPYLGELNLSGLIVFCSDSLYFYSFPNDSYMGLTTLKEHENPDNKTQCMCISDLKNIRASLPKKGRFSFLFPEESRIINFTAGEPDSTVSFNLSFLKKAEPVYNEIQKILLAKSID